MCYLCVVNFTSKRFAAVCSWVSDSVHRYIFSLLLNTSFPEEKGEGRGGREGRGKEGGGEGGRRAGEGEWRGREEGHVAYVYAIKYYWNEYKGISWCAVSILCWNLISHCRSISAHESESVDIRAHLENTARKESKKTRSGRWFGGRAYTSIRKCWELVGLNPTAALLLGPQVLRTT